MRNIDERRSAPPAALTIAGSDSGGGAGIQADLRTFAVLGVHGLSAITAVTAQNTRAVTAIQPLAPPILRAQLDAVLGDFPVGAIKTGMLATPALVRTVAEVLARRPRIPLVLDPVLVATTGAELGGADLVRALRRHLIARAALVTPNIPEAEALTGRRIRDADGMRAAARDLLAQGARAVLLKGGHVAGPVVADLLAADGRERWMRHPRVPGEGHGTGCTLSAAIAAELALGRSLASAVRRASDFVHRALSAGYCPGRGRLLVLDHRAAARRPRR